jgi:hypothetical protein
MSALRPVTLGFLISLSACADAPTDTPSSQGPLYSGVGAPRILSADGTQPNYIGRMAVNFELAGLGSGASQVVTVTAEGSGVWGCMTTTTGEFDVYPPLEIATAPVSETSTSLKSSGRFIGSVVLAQPEPPTMQCLRPSHTLSPLTTTFSDVTVTHPEAPPFGLGLFSVQHHFTHFEVVPDITSVVPEQTTWQIGQSYNYVVSIDNSGIIRPNADVVAWIRQGRNYRAGGGTQVICAPPAGYPLGTLPGGNCTFSFSTGASTNPNATGVGTFVPGPAVFELHLEVGSSFRVLDGFTVPVVLTN